MGPQATGVPKCVNKIRITRILWGPERGPHVFLMQGPHGTSYASGVAPPFASKVATILLVMDVLSSW
ncbi:hypothetical protein TNCV_1938651 [Trichonephila clavipes]|nr:hypothetical protein TNCV_1938651 [Trichonephila clavipes]